MKRLLSFLIAGSVGFALDAGMTLLILHATTASPFIARFVGIAAALGFTWLFNRTFTFGRSAHSLAKEGVRYATVGVVSTAVNYAVFASLLLAIPDLQPLVALTLGSASGTLFGFFGYSRFVFRHHNR